MSTLYELTGAYKQIQELIDQGEDLEGILATLEDAIEVKAEAYAKVMRNNEATMDAITAEITRLTGKKQSLLNANNRLKGNLYESMKATGKTKFKTDLFSFTIAKNGGKTPVVLKVDEAYLPEHLVKITRTANNDAIREYIEATGDITYAELGDRGESLRIR